MCCAAIGGAVETAEGFTRAGGDPFGANQAAIEAIFDELVLTGGQVTQVTELDADSAAIFRVSQYHEATLKPLEEVRGEIEHAHLTFAGDLADRLVVGLQSAPEALGRVVLAARFREEVPDASQPQEILFRGGQIRSPRTRMSDEQHADGSLPASIDDRVQVAAVFLQTLGEIG